MVIWYYNKYSKYYAILVSYVEINDVTFAIIVILTINMKYV